MKLPYSGIKMKKLLFALFLVSVLAACKQEKPLIVNPGRLNDIEKMLKIQKELTVNSVIPIWNILDNPSSPDEEQALKFLFAYMPLSDLADYSPGFMRANVRQSLQTRSEMSWGKEIPEEEFLHFVLPLRVNNENLDSFRLVYQEELKARVKGLTMKEAALEINHWCHEKVNYRGTDSRTSAPMSTIKKTFGRCGEESTFTVAAMRTAGIPSRQVYTPRWAHTDDNHAWVEVWIDGKWHFMGACEPDTDLDRGWFSEPSQRTMLVHTRTYGHYFGSEEVLEAQDRFSELNLTANYAKTKNVTILVSDSEGKSVEGAKVEFKLYNYAEFYPLASLFTNNQGRVAFTTGFGDLLVWASKDSKFVYQKLHVATTDTLRLVLGNTKMDGHTEEFDLVPPKLFKVIGKADEPSQKRNNLRLAREDSIRNRYAVTFKDSGWIRSFAKSRNLAEDKLMRLLRLSYGNANEIINYLEDNRFGFQKDLFSMTEGISVKDLSDTKASILTDHLRVATATGNPEGVDTTVYKEYILAPRIDLEMLTSWRGFLVRSFGPEMAIAARKEVNVLVSWINANVKIDKVANKHSRAPITPVGVFNLRVADPLSRDIFFVAACRSFGIPARLNPATHVPEYMFQNSWRHAAFEALTKQPEMGQLVLKDAKNSLIPQYSLHFTIARIEDGRSQTLEFDESEKLSDFPSPLLLETGNYLLVTGRRRSDNSVLSSISFFGISKEKPALLEVKLRDEPSTLKMAGKIDPTRITLTASDQNKPQTLAGLMKGSGAVVVLLDPDSEPSKHILNDLAPYVDKLNQWEGQFIFVNTAEKQSKSTAFGNYKLPSKTIFSSDTKSELASAISLLKGKDASNNLPQVIFTISSGEVLFFSGGYKIGIGEQLLEILRSVASKSEKEIKASCTAP